MRNNPERPSLEHLRESVEGTEVYLKNDEHPALAAINQGRLSLANLLNGAQPSLSIQEQQQRYWAEIKERMELMDALEEIVHKAFEEHFFAGSVADINARFALSFDSLKEEMIKVINAAVLQEGFELSELTEEEWRHLLRYLMYKLDPKNQDSIPGVETAEEFLARLEKVAHGDARKARMWLEVKYNELVRRMRKRRVPGEEVEKYIDIFYQWKKGNQGGKRCHFEKLYKKLEAEYRDYRTS